MKLKYSQTKMYSTKESEIKWKKCLSLLPIVAQIASVRYDRCVVICIRPY